MEESRLKAAKRGNRFFEGQPCKHGHGTTRYVLSGGCAVCVKEKAKASYKRTRAKLLGAKAGT